MSSTAVLAPSLRFHLSLNVADLQKSVAFYACLFGKEPAKQRADYAKFELDDPPVTLSLEPTAPVPGGALNHLGFRFPDAAALVDMQERLERAGIRSQREDRVECCYARQSKFWVTDPDNNLWEFYTLEADLEHRGAGQSLEQMLPHSNGTNQAAPVVWQHVLSATLPDELPHAAGTVDEVHLRGSFNMPLTAKERGKLLEVCQKVLRPGGRLFVHVLTGEQEVHQPQLGGPAAVVQYVPQTKDVLHWLQEAEFQRIQLLKYDDKPCFVAQGVPMRETKIEAWKQ